MKELEKELIEGFKDRGIDIAEEALKIVIEEVLEYASKKVLETENKFDDMLLAVMPIVKKELLKLVDKIDGEEG